MIPVKEALDIIISNATPLDTQTIPVESALTYALVNDVVADRPLPPFDRVAMDGFAVRSSDFKGDSVELKRIGEIQTGVESGLEVKPGEAAQIMTGAPCPKGADAVVKVENSEIRGNRVKLTEAKMKPGLNIAPMGEDKAKGDLMIEAGTALSTTGIAICASVGLAQVEVYRKPNITVISTGTEIVSPDQVPLDHQIRDCNSYTIRSMCQRNHLQSRFLGIGQDDPDILGQMIREGLLSDILILSGGVSMGEYDLIPSLLAENGVHQLIYKVKVKPGKPLWFGKTDSGTFVFGLPGNPVSVQTCFRIFVEPLIKALSGYHQPRHSFLKLPLSEDTASKTPREHYMPGKLRVRSSGTFIEPVNIRGSGDFSNFVASQGLFCFPADKNLLKAGTLMDFLPWSEHW